MSQSLKIRSQKSQMRKKTFSEQVNLADIQTNFALLV